MQEIHALNSDTYVLGLSTASASITFNKQYGSGEIYAIIYNGSDKDAFFVAGETQPTAVFPTSATVPVKGKVVPAGAIVTYKLPLNTQYMSGIHGSSGGTGNAHIAIGGGI